MASVSQDPKGGYRVQFVDGGKRRRSIYLGQVSRKAAQSVAGRVEALNVARITGTHWDTDLAAWVRDLSPALAAKLARAGLVGPRPKVTTLDAFIRGYIAGRSDLKPATVLGMEQTRDRLMAVFAPDTELRDVTPADADRWLIHLRGRYAEATAARTLKRARQFFTAARRARIITENPFEGIKPGSMKNAGRLYYVTAEAVAKLIEACPDADWRAIVALCRWGGLRCPSEVLALTWGDVDWDRGRFLVRASKTEHHEHRGMRWVPLFPELRPHLEALWDRAEPGQVHVITRYRVAVQNLRTTFLKIIHRAGLLPWPRLMQNLRATRETELAARFPLHVVTSWMGNTEAVAARHYLSVRDEDFAAALRPAPAESVHQPVQRPTAGPCEDLKPSGPAGGPPGGKPRRLPGDSAGFSPSQDLAEHTTQSSVAAVGPEPAPVSPGESAVPLPVGAPVGARPDAPDPTWLSDLAASLTPEQWARLAELRGPGP